MSRMVRILLAITCVANLTFILAVHELATRLEWPAPWLIALVATVIGIILFVNRVSAIMPDRRRNAAEVRFFDVPFYVHWTACIFTLVPGTVGTLLLAVADLVRGVPLHWHGGFYLWLQITGVVVCGYGVLVRRKWFVVDEIDVPVDGLDKRFDGYRVAHLSDLHIGALTPKEWGFRWAEASNAQKPDLVAVTGDLVTSGVDFHEDIAEVIGKLEGKDGVVVSMGNHDYFGEGEPLVSLLRARGARVLRNEGYVLEHDGAKLHIAAIDDTWTRRANLDRALEGKPDGVATLLLAHDPGEFPRAAERNVALTIAGHTHGGQLAVPFLGRWLSLSHLAHKFHIGIYRLGRSTLYVHPGLGTTGPPIRLGVAPAVVILKLRAA